MERGVNMHNYLLRINDNTFQRIKLLAKKYNKSINSMIIELLENGYIEFIRRDKND